MIAAAPVPSRGGARPGAGRPSYADLEARNAALVDERAALRLEVTQLKRELGVLGAVMTRGARILALAFQAERFDLSAHVAGTLRAMGESATRKAAA